jgi:hypothetical protein
MIGCLVKLKVVSEIRNLSTFVEEGLLSNGINTTLNIIVKMILHLKQSKDINLISSIRSSMISKKLLNIILKRLKVQIIV